MVQLSYRGRILIALIAIFALAAIATGGIRFTHIARYKPEPTLVLPPAISTPPAAQPVPEEAVESAPTPPEPAPVPNVGVTPIAPEPPAAEKTPPPVKIAVAAAGAVSKPGLYRLPEGSRVEDLLREAHGATEEADMSDINIAAELLDGTTLTLPSLPRHERSTGQIVLRRVRSAAELNPPAYTRSGWRDANALPAPPVPEAAAEPVAETSARAKPTATPSGGSGKINLNTATQQELEGLPGIGPKTAAKIIEYRAQTPFQAVEDLEKVSGIGPKKLDAVRPFVMVR